MNRHKRVVLTLLVLDHNIMWSKIKSMLRKLVARILPAFKKTIKIAFESITDKDLRGWYQHAGYQI